MSATLISNAARVASRSSTSTVPPCAACCGIRFSHKLVEVELLQTSKLGEAGQRKTVAPGRARMLYPQKALYVVKGRPVSPMRDLLKNSAELEARRRKTLERLNLAQARLANTTETPAVETVDPAFEVEQRLYDTLLALPQPLTFPRRLIHPASSNTSQQTEFAKGGGSEIYGSVQASDVISALKEHGAVVSEDHSRFRDVEGLEKGRIKSTGTFIYDVSFRLLERTLPVEVVVVPEA